MSLFNKLLAWLSLPKAAPPTPYILPQTFSKWQDELSCEEYALLQSLCDTKHITIRELYDILHGA